MSDYRVERAEPGADWRCCYETAYQGEAEKHYEQAVRLTANCGGAVRLRHGDEVMASFERGRK